MTDEKNYQEALDYLYGFVDFSLTRQQNLSPEKFNLARMQRFLLALGNPENRYKVIHVAGTKGKGSVCAFCSRVLQEEGYLVGLYTSPHLRDFEERIQINGTLISRDDLVKIITKIKPNVEIIPQLTTFEISTAIAFLYFAEQKVDVAVVEVGLGGRLDATNLVSPLVSVITSISFDHTYVLGNSLEEIATEKAGIIKPGVPVVVGPQNDDALRAIKRTAFELGAPLVDVGKDFQFSIQDSSLDGQTILVWRNNLSSDGSVIEKVQLKEFESINLRIKLLGSHQAENAITAFATLKVAETYGLPISFNSIKKGFQNTLWPARFEVLRRDPPVVVDSAHNVDSFRRLRLSIDDYFPDRPVVLVLGVSEDKDVRGMVAELLPRVQHIVCTQSTHPRAMEAKKLAEILNKEFKLSCTYKNIRGAFSEAEDIANDQALVLVAGSIFVAASARIAWFEWVG